MNLFKKSLKLLEENFHKNYFPYTFIQLFGFTLSINDGGVAS